MHKGQNKIRRCTWHHPKAYHGGMGIYKGGFLRILKRATVHNTSLLLLNPKLMHVGGLGGDGVKVPNHLSKWRVGCLSIVFICLSLPILIMPLFLTRLIWDADFRSWRSWGKIPLLCAVVPLTRFPGILFCRLQFLFLWFLVPSWAQAMHVPPCPSLVLSLHASNTLSSSKSTFS